MEAVAVMLAILIILLGLMYVVDLLRARRFLEQARRKAIMAHLDLIDELLEAGEDRAAARRVVTLARMLTLQ